MQVLIESEKVVLDGNALAYYPYYFAIWKDTADHRITVKSVLAQWAAALESLRSNENAVYLPYYLDDQTCRYLKAELEGENVVLTDLLVKDAGYAMDLDDLSPEIYSAPEILSAAPEFFGRYKAEELIEALRSAEINAG